MAKRKARRTSKKKTDSTPMLSSEARREIAAVFLAVLALLLAFGVFGFGGSLVTGMLHELKLAFGAAATVAVWRINWQAGRQRGP